MWSQPVGHPGRVFCSWKMVFLLAIPNPVTGPKAKGHILLLRNVREQVLLPVELRTLLP